ncbi:MAG: tetratricopeptide repeat protein [Cystobacterineae bacterium]|nr:tetratricopeptide repeat protein [Cystobacterineae bacterium]
MQKHPDALAFVEHAKALLEERAFEQAIELCRQGVEEHPTSIVGRVLWGKALVRLGKPADAMQEFEAAIAIDRENPRVYGLVAEVFIENKLFRSALPMLRKACSLEPENPNFRLYLEYTQKALAGESLPEFISLLSWTEFEEAPPPTEAEVDDDGPTQSVDPELDEDGPTQAFKVEHEEDEAFEEEEEEEEEAEVITEQHSPVSSSSQRWKDNGRGGLVAHIPARQPEAKEAAPSAQARRTSAQVMQTSSRPLKSVTLTMLEALPDLPQEQKAPIVSTTAQAYVAEREGQAYEHKLKEELEAKEKRKTFLKKWVTGIRGAFVFSGLVVVLAVAGFLVSYGWAENRQALMTEHLVKARRSINLDMQANYELALESLNSVLALEGANLEAWSLKALVHARRFQEFGGAPQEKEAALQAIEQEGVRQFSPNTALLVDAIVGPQAEREKAARNILASKELSSDIQSEAGWLLLAENKPEEALARFNHAVQLFATNVRALIGLSETYLALREDDHAYQILNTPALTNNAAEHPLRILGLARARLELNREMEASLRQMELLSPETGLPHEWRMQRERVYGLLLSALGNEDKAIVVLEQGKRLFEANTFEFGLDLGDVYLRAGQVLSAQKQFEEALKQRPNSLEAKEKLAKVLVSRGQADEILKKVSPDSDELVFARAWALMRLGDWKKLREELDKTKVKKKYTSRALAFLAMADMAENNVPKARSNLEAALKNLQRSQEKAPLQLALAHVLMSSAPEEAKALLQAAVAEPIAEEAACVLAKLLMEEGHLAQANSELQKALQRNGSLTCVRSLSIAVLGELGQFEDTYAEALQWTEDDAQAMEAWQALSLAAMRLGKADEALKAAEKALSFEKENIRSLRLKAEALFALGRPMDAMGLLKRANEKNPRDADTFCSVGMGFFRQNDMNNAQIFFETALKNAPHSICGTVGFWLAQPPSSKLVAEMASKAPAIKPAWERSIALAAWANAQWSMGSLTQASQTAEKALLTAPSLAMAQWVFGKVAAHNKREQEAVLALRRAIQLEPAWAEPYVLLADLLAKRPETVEQAMVSYRNFLKLNKNRDAQKLVEKKLQALRQ